MKRASAHVTVLLLIGMTSGAHGQDNPLFTDITEAVKLDFTHEPGSEGKFLLPEITGSGAAFLDYDDDGDLDIYLVQSGPFPGSKGPSPPMSNRLFRQETDGTFTDVTSDSGLGDPGYGMGVAVGDIDNDGLVDVYVTNYGPDALYRNLGRGRFENITTRAGISGDAWSASAVFCDHDADGYLDLYVTHYVTYDPENPCTRGDGSADYCSPRVFPGTPDVLYKNNGNGSFTDVSTRAGLRGVSAPGLGVICADFNQDRRLDFYVANDGAANQLWVNQGDGCFEDEAFLTGAALNGMGQPEAGMGLTVGDVDNDGDLDLFVTHLINETNTLYRNDGNLGFKDLSATAGLGASSLALTGFGTAFFDYDHDGDLDLVIVNGRVQRNPPLPDAGMNPYWNPYAEPNLIMENDGRGHFTDITASSGPLGSRIEVSRGLALGDVDEDGDLDLLVANTATRARLFRNDSRKKGHWLLVRAYDPALRRDAHGAVVMVTAGGEKYVRVADPGFSFLSSNDPRAHFGFPSGSKVERIFVRWPDGTQEVFPGVAPNQAIVLGKGRGKKSR